MVCVYVSTSGLVPVCKNDMNSMASRRQSFKASVCKNVFKLIRNLHTGAFLKLKLSAAPEEPRINAGTLGQAIKEKTMGLVDSAFKI